MAKQFPCLDKRLQGFIEAQHIYFTATAAAQGRVNLSPKGMDSLRVLGPTRILWLNLTGSGNETAGHLLQSNRITLMWCSFTAKPMILRAYGSARPVHPRDTDWGPLYAHFPAHPGARQIFDMDIDLVQTSCGYSVPFFDHRGHRDTLDTWANDKGAKGLRAFQEEKNLTTLDGAPTGLFETP
ncbi:MAG: pyridoxamine 5'-phosphate oxidase family protein [Rhodobacteraceae bacterium]|nr:pyridoxamine 5'-phosphate oxidase family protein [Paracoccaceae bacterium]